MRLLLDTHLVLWWEAGSTRLPVPLRSMVDQADAVFVSRASLWEIAVKVSIGKLRLDIEKAVVALRQARRYQERALDSRRRVAAP